MVLSRATACGAAAWLLATGASAAPPGPPSRRVDKAILLQRDVRRRYMELIQTMQQVAAKLEQSDPETAAALSAAAQKAEAALIADDMEKVITLLRSGLIVPADSTQAKIIRRLRQVLEALYGADEDWEARVQRLERLRRQMEALKDIMRRQRSLERMSSALAFGAETIAQIDAADAKARAMRSGQHDLMLRTEKLTFKAGGQDLSAARRNLREFLRRLDALKEALADAFPLPDTVAANIASAQTLAGEAVTARIEVKTLVNRLAGGTGAAPEAASAVECLAKTAAELWKVAEALKKDRLADAQVAGAEAQSQLAAAVGVLDTAVVTLLGSGDAGRIVGAQQDLAGQAGALLGEVDKLAPPGGAPEDAEDEEGPQVVGRKHVVARQTYLRKSSKGPESPVIAGMEAARTALGGADKASAGFAQAQVLRALDGWIERLTLERSRIRAVRADPHYAEQAIGQEKLADEMQMLARGEVPGRKKTDDAEAPPGLPGDLGVVVTDASKLARRAAEFLGRKEPAPANKLQREILALLEYTLEELKSEYEVTANVLLEELGQQVLSALERVLLQQQVASADTIALWKKRQPDGTYARAEQLRFRVVSRTQGKVLALMDEMRRVMSTAMSSHQVVLFPPTAYLILDMVAADVKVCEQRLTAEDGGPETQRIQKLNEERLAGLLKAMRPAIESLTTPPAWADNSWGTVEVSRVDRVAEVLMLLTLQAQINRRTEELEKMRAAGRTDGVDVPAELDKLAGQQVAVTGMLEGILANDLARSAAQGGW